MGRLSGNCRDLLGVHVELKEGAQPFLILGKIGKRKEQLLVKFGIHSNKAVLEFIPDCFRGIFYF